MLARVIKVDDRYGTREVQIGQIPNPLGSVIRDPNSTTYTGAIESAEDFGKRILRIPMKWGTDSDLSGSLESRLEPRGKKGCWRA
jgi:hypothetical protein